LPVDRDIEIAIASGAPLRPAIDLSDARARIGLGRALMRRRERLQRFVDEMAAFVRESELAQAPLVNEIKDIETAFADHVRSERKATGENTLTVPGIGVWSTRRANPRWKIDNRLVIEALDPDGRAYYTEKLEPELKLKRDAYIGDVLDPLLLFDDEGTEIGIDDAPPTGVERVPAGVNVSYDLNV
jgi:hypothetical protein